MEPRWLVLAGLLLAAAAFLREPIERLPVSAAMLYFAAGVLIGPMGFDWWRVAPLEDARLLEIAAEVAVVISLFAVGLKIKAANARRQWREPVLLASVGMVLTVAGVATLGVWGLGLPAGPALLLGAILAPTDPVLASDVQLRSPRDDDRLRFTLTAEGGLNDGTAFPFVMLGLAWLAADTAGTIGHDWVTVDVLWASLAGLGIGYLCGRAASAVIRQRQRRRSLVLDEFLLLGLVAIAYGVALLAGSYGFLAVFAAGFSLRQLAALPLDPSDGQTTGSVGTLLRVNEQLERVLELATVLLIGVLFSSGTWSLAGLALAAALLFVIRPAAVALCLAGARWPFSSRWRAMWFGVRGIGSVYYLGYAITHGFSGPAAREVAALVVSVLAVSIVAHGVTGAPLMARFGLRDRARSSEGGGA
jgi:NhaP-type Na+/H+ or K+/H+ antiporter